MKTLIYSSLLSGLATLLLASSAQAEIAVSANDGKQILRGGTVVIPAPAETDSISILDLSGTPRLKASIAAPASVTGPPTSVAVAPDESFALVTAARKFSSAQPATLVPDDVLTVLSLKGEPKITATLHTGPGASGVSINPAGTVALVANKVDGTISVFTIKGGVLTPAGVVGLGAESSPSHPVFYDKGRRAAVTRGGDGSLALLSIDGAKVYVRTQTVPLARGASAFDTAGPRRFAVAGAGGGAAATASILLIDLAPDVPVVADTAPVKATPESVKMSPDGRYVAVNSHNGSGVLPTAPGYNPEGRLQVFRIDDGKLVKVAEAVSGAWGQGIVWTRDSRRILVQATRDKRIDTYAFDGKTLTQTSSLPMPTAPVGFRTAER